MKIIQISPHKNGGRPPIQNWCGEKIPQGYAFIQSTLDTSAFYDYNSFVNLIIEDDTVTAMTPNIEAWQAWKSSLLEPGKEIDPVKKLRADLDYTMMMTEVI